MDKRYDVLIVGGGMVGATIACALGGSDLSVGVLEYQYPKGFDPEQPHDLRVSAISVASQNVIDMVGAWEGILSRRSCPYRRMKVWESDEQRAATEFVADDISEPYLGHIVENRIIQLALLERMAAFDNVDLVCPAKTVSIDYSPGASVVTLEDGTELIGRLLVAADGGESRVRQAAGIGVRKWDYEQSALVASVITDYPQQDITWQQFTATGPLAFLPLSGPHASLVWYNTPQNVKRLMSLPVNQFMTELTETFPESLGKIDTLLERGFFPLRRQHALEYAKEGVVLAGDAAHMIHPLAGQGVNIGMLDAAALAETLLLAQRSGKDITSLAVLKAYERQRRNHNLVMMQTMDLFYRVFSNDNMPLKVMRNIGLGLAERVTPAKNKVMRFAMGLEGPLPALAKMQDIL
ncbi:UbiH/UbiF/VisC/COQ6 family ubiquinone biosynthesis hydroxylase [Pontibacterium granulatum]|uniref:UbiH/UbiF/VisC/COQ6 family ubiquinone biosynthesis hydroxylase n=1 Tax=Pontibacterium granulatum TaxID=2036029 RepID=UPI00249CD368|nr:UbiH/UbiF/VisC/COQ6 family ubiquinone biosynthesis hydroxylase [Pontibacterium granulatum]MDI3324938.1 UbiH/UbiF/VisC/COQ6 family ubiquinone biosynthesis hydroxylase [Pontibacterium granulatum]